MKLQLMKKIDTDSGGFEGSLRLESRHGGFPLRTVSPHSHTTRQTYLSIACIPRDCVGYDEPALVIQVQR